MVAEGNDTLNGGNMVNTTFIGGDGYDILNGGDFIPLYGVVNTASYTTVTSAVTVDLNIITAQNTGGAGIDTLINISSLVGSNFNDNLTGGTILAAQVTTLFAALTVVII